MPSLKHTIVKCSMTQLLVYVVKFTHYDYVLFLRFYFWFSIKEIYSEYSYYLTKSFSGKRDYLEFSFLAAKPAKAAKAAKRTA